MAKRTSARRVVFRALLLSGWCAAAAAVPCAAASKSPPCPEVVKWSHSVHLRLPSALRHALAEAAPGFRPLTMADFSKDVRRSYRVTKSQAPWAVIGDFDGDGFCDLIVDGRTRTDSYRLCAWGSPEGPRVMTLGRRRLPAHVRPSTAALALVPREEVEARITARADSTHSDVFGEQASGELTRIYYWRGSRFAALRRK